MKLFAALFAVSLIAAACGSDDAADTTSDSGDSAALEEAQDALAAAQAAASEAEDAAAAAEAEAAAAVAAAESGGDEVEVREFEGKIIRITGSERSPEEWGAIEESMVPWEEETGAEVIFTARNWALWKRAIRS